MKVYEIRRGKRRGLTRREIALDLVMDYFEVILKERAGEIEMIQVFFK
jgi:hypothetical protein